MQTAPHPLTRDLVLIGGGHTHALVLRKWAMSPMAGVRVTVINPGPTAPYSGMLPGMVAGHYARGDLDIDLVRLARAAGARVIIGRATGIDRIARRIAVAGHAPVFYDIASIDVGITSDLPALPGFTEHAVPAKPLGAFADRWAAFLDRCGDAPRVGVIGAGVAGCELAMACAHRLGAMGRDARVTLFEAGATPLPGIGAGARRALMARMESLGADVRTNARITAVDADGVQLTEGRVDLDFTLGAAGTRPQDWLADTGLALENGFVRVLPDLRTETDPRLYAVGDCAHMTHDPRPKAGVFAVRQAPILFHNLRADLAGQGAARKPYHPQKDYLKLISTGGKHAVADKLSLRLEGDWLWRWKDRIDRKFMDQFRDLPVMGAPDVPDGELAEGLRDLLTVGEMPCGGCAAKPGADVLATGIADGACALRPDVILGGGDDAAVLRAGDGLQVLSVDQLRAFWDDPYVMARIAAIHALGDVWAMGAAPQAVLSNIILPRMRDRMHGEVLREITAGAASVFDDVGAAVIGGHTSVGPELSIGFTVTGTLGGDARGHSVDQARAGDRLILTKSIGSGTIMAAEMRAAAPGAVVVEALRRMGQEGGEAARILSPVAHAMTDVTGYGLIGHLRTIVAGSGVGARIDVPRVPLMAGARELAAGGARSSLFPQNLRLCDGIDGFDPDLPEHALLIDPQTAGGLLTTVPADKVAATLRALIDAGYDAADIGEMTGAGITLT